MSFRLALTTVSLFLLIGPATAASNTGTPDKVGPAAASKQSVANADATPTLAGLHISGARLPIAFEPNRGQFISRVRFAGHAEGALILLGDSGVEIELSGRNSREHTATEVRTLKLIVKGLSSNVKLTGMDRLPGKVNYLVGPDSSHWIRNLETYRRVEYNGGGLGLAFYGNHDGTLEYDLIVPPSVHPDRVRLRVEGADKMHLDRNGDLIITIGEREVRQRKPVAYTGSSDARQLVQVSYAIGKPGEVGFKVGRYDHRGKLVIDPALVYSSYLGGSLGDTEAGGLAIDSSGNTYVTGHTRSASFPTTANAVEPNCFPSTIVFGGCSSVLMSFVTKVNPAGTAIVYSTFLGGQNAPVNGGAGAAWRRSHRGGNRWQRLSGGKPCRPNRS